MKAQKRKQTLVGRLDLLDRAAHYVGIMEACAAYVAVERPQMIEPEAAVRFLRPVIEAQADNKQESFFVILLDTKNRAMQTPVEASRGLVNSCPVHPREVFSKAIEIGAQSIIIAHNHPSGDSTPSKEDCDITRRLVEAARILGVRLVDHLILGKASDTRPGYCSLREKNLVAFD